MAPEFFSCFKLAPFSRPLLQTISFRETLCFILLRKVKPHELPSDDR